MTRANKIRWNVLVFPAGTENGLEIWRSLRDCKEVRLFAASGPGGNHSSFVYNTVAQIPLVNNPSWVDALSEVIRLHEIDFLFPANDLVIDALNGARAAFACGVILPSPRAVALARSKTATLACVSERVPTPAVYAEPSAIPSYPVFVKPDAGYGAQGAEIVRSAAELEALLARRSDLVIQEYLPGREFSVDCFTNRHGRLQFAAPRERARVRMGTSFNSTTLNDDRGFAGYAQDISDLMGMRGAWFFQMKEDTNGALRLLEVDVRIAGTMALHRVAGVNFPLLSLYDHANEDVELLTLPFEIEIDRCIGSRYRADFRYERVYVDLDDTLVVHGKINTQLVRFLYQCLNAGISITLITKSLENDLSAYLARLRLDRLFDTVIHLPLEADKSEHMHARGSLFIDDSFAARKLAAARGIVAMHPSQIEMLLDDRI